MSAHLTTRGFDWKQGCTHFGDTNIDAIRCVRVAHKLAAKFSWFKPAIRDIRMLRIEDNNDSMAEIENIGDGAYSPAQAVPPPIKNGTRALP